MGKNRLVSRFLPGIEPQCEGRAGAGCSCPAVIQVSLVYVVAGHQVEKLRKLCRRCSVLWLASRIEQKGLSDLPAEVLDPIADALKSDKAAIVFAPISTNRPSVWEGVPMRRGVLLREGNLCGKPIT